MKHEIFSKLISSPILYISDKLDIWKRRWLDLKMSEMLTSCYISYTANLRVSNWDSNLEYQEHLINFFQLEAPSLGVQGLPKPFLRGALEKWPSHHQMRTIFTWPAVMTKCLWSDVINIRSFINLIKDEKSEEMIVYKTRHFSIQMDGIMIPIYYLT